MGICVINSEPPLEACDMLGKLAKEYDIPVGIHNHPKNPNNPNYLHWSPDFVLKCADGNEGWVGSNSDTGHWMRSNIVPMDALKKVQGHIVSMHLKDLNKMGQPDEHDVPYGTGKANIPAILTFLDKIGYKGPISLEYEYDLEDSIPEIAQCVGFVRGYGAALEGK